MGLDMYAFSVKKENTNELNEDDLDDLEFIEKA